MPGKEILKITTSPDSGDIAKADAGHETLPKTPRVEVFGSRLSGAFDLGEELRAYLAQRGFPDADVGITRFATNIVNSFFGRQHSPEPGSVDTLPQAVLVLPEMRQTDPISGAKMTIPTPVEAIQELCQKHGVTMAVVDRIEDQKQLAEGVDRLLSP